LETKTDFDMQKMFFELIQVSLGQLDCLDRGPSNEEWETLHEWSKKHGLTALCYQGVVKLFEFGLRAPQDLSIDWMAEAEEADMGGKEPQQIPAISHPLRRQLVERWLVRNGGSLTEQAGDQRQYVPSASIVLLMLQAFEDFHAGRLTLKPVVDCFTLLQEHGKSLGKFRDGSSVPQMLRTFGIWRFSQAMMWAAQQVCLLPADKMPVAPRMSAGHFLLDELTGGKNPWKIRLKNRIRKFLMF
jgi:hypothetical protein